MRANSGRAPLLARWRQLLRQAAHMAFHTVFIPRCCTRSESASKLGFIERRSLGMEYDDEVCAAGCCAPCLEWLAELDLGHAGNTSARYCATFRMSTCSNHC